MVEEGLSCDVELEKFCTVNIHLYDLNINDMPFGLWVREIGFDGVVMVVVGSFEKLYQRLQPL